MFSGCSSPLFKCNALGFVGEEIHVSTVCICVPVPVLAVADQCFSSLHFFSRAELSLSPALLHDSRAALFLQIDKQLKECRN